jgi:hypothetical protein
MGLPGAVVQKLSFSTLLCQIKLYLRRLMIAETFRVCNPIEIKEKSNI